MILNGDSKNVGMHSMILAFSPTYPQDQVLFLFVQFDNIFWIQIIFS